MPFHSVIVCNAAGMTLLARHWDPRITSSLDESKYFEAALYQNTSPYWGFARMRQSVSFMYVAIENVLLCVSASPFSLNIFIYSFFFFTYNIYFTCRDVHSVFMTVNDLILFVSGTNDVEELQCNNLFSHSNLVFDFFTGKSIIVSEVLNLIIEIMKSNFEAIVSEAQLLVAGNIGKICVCIDEAISDVS